MEICDVTAMTEEDQWSRGPIWACDCGALLTIDAQQPLRILHTTCDTCARRYRNQRIDQGTWRVTLIEGAA